MGVWIEIYKTRALNALFPVTPCVGVWIEMGDKDRMGNVVAVTPCVGVWIEITAMTVDTGDYYMSLPAWECGLKFSFAIVVVQINGSLPAWECGLKYINYAPY